MTRDNVFHAEVGRSSIQCLSPKYATECAVVFLAHLRHDRIHCPSVQLAVGQDFQRHVVLLLIAFDRLVRNQLAFDLHW